MVGLKRVFLSAAFAALMVAPVSANAGLLGSTVDVKTYYPDTSSVLVDGGVESVGAGVEYPVGTFAGYNKTASVDLTNNSIIIAGDFGFFDPGQFNGFGIASLTGQRIVSASIDGLSTLSPASLNIVGNELFVNFEGVQSAPGETKAIIDVVSAPIGGVPEPETWTVLLLGMFGLGGLLRARRNAQAGGAAAA